jgi:hypothetical protein
VNPLVRTKQLFIRGHGHEIVDRALATEPGRLLDYSTHPGAMLAAFGWPLLGGVQVSPDLALFRFLAPEAPGLSEEIYNRYAHYSFVLPPARTELVYIDLFRVAISPCSRRLAALGVNHFLVPASAVPPTECSSELSVTQAGELHLWSRKRPVCAIGVAHREPSSALDFDYSCGPEAEARFSPAASGFSISAPGDPSRWFALALNPAVVGSIHCRGATLRFIDAHLVFHPEGPGVALCTGDYLDSVDAMRRILRRSSG